MDRSDTDRLQLLDRIADRVPELDLAQNEVGWKTLDDGHEALLVNGGGLDGGDGAYFANAGDDLHAVGSMSPLVEGYVGLHRDQAGLQSPSRSRGARPAGGAEVN